MKKVSGIAVVMIALGVLLSSCGGSDLPADAQQYLKDFKAFADESIAMAKEGKAIVAKKDSINVSDTAAVDAYQKEATDYQDKVNAFKDKANAITAKGGEFESKLNRAQQEKMAEEITKIQEATEAEIAKLQ